MIFKLLKIFLLIISFSISAQINNNLSQNKYFELALVNLTKLDLPENKKEKLRSFAEFLMNRNY